MILCWSLAFTTAFAGNIVSLENSVVNIEKNLPKLQLTGSEIAAMGKKMLTARYTSKEDLLWIENYINSLENHSKQDTVAYSLETSGNGVIKITHEAQQLSMKLNDSFGSNSVIGNTPFDFSKYTSAKEFIENLDRIVSKQMNNMNRTSFIHSITTIFFADADANFVGVGLLLLVIGLLTENPPLVKVGGGLLLVQIMSQPASADEVINNCSQQEIAVKDREKLLSEECKAEVKNMSKEEEQLLHFRATALKSSVKAADLSEENLIKAEADCKALDQYKRTMSCLQKSKIDLVDLCKKQIDLLRCMHANTNAAFDGKHGKKQNSSIKSNEGQNYSGDGIDK